MDHFGVSYSVAKWQIHNGLDQRIPVEDLKVRSTAPADHWRGTETFTIDYFRPESTPFSRRGRFAYCVAKALNNGLISSASAAIYLQCDEREVIDRAPAILRNFE